ncbi:hypothetical protein ROZALSC1DRAFT_25138, partial [Rozella allomycis CSF55]
MSLDFKKESRYKKYVLSVDRILGSFETDVKEWPDIITFLTRLQKCILANDGIPSVPRKRLIFKRLSQCLNGALPAGVHQKTLEVYEVVLGRVSECKLVDNFGMGCFVDLIVRGVYMYAFLGFYGYASMNVKPLWLSVMEKYVVCLGGKIGYCMRNVILSLFGGMEEEGSEYFEKTVELMNELKRSGGSFYDGVWEAIEMNESHRIGGYNYVNKNGDSENEEEEEKSIKGDEKEILIETLKRMIRDKSKMIRGYKVMISLMDKSEIGNILIKEIFYESISNLMRIKKEEEFEIILQTANMFYEICDTFEIWEMLFQKLKNISNEFYLEFEFIFDHLKIFDDEAI